MNTLVSSVVALGGLGVTVGLGLAYASIKLSVKVDPLIEKVRDVLPGINCGACGFTGCNAYAEAVVTENAKTNLCIPGGARTSVEVALTLGVEPEATRKLSARVLCQGGNAETVRKFEYQGVSSCHVLNQTAGGDNACPFGCLGQGSCAVVCPFDAIHMNENGLPEINISKCTGCGLCAGECPRSVIIVTEAEHAVDIRCRSTDKGGVVKKYCQPGCIGCGRCVKICPFEAIELKDSLARTLYEKCTSCGICVKECPQNTITRGPLFQRSAAPHTVHKQCCSIDN